MRSLLTPAPRLRLTAQQALAHPFLAAALSADGQPGAARGSFSEEDEAGRDARLAAQMASMAGKSRLAQRSLLAVAFEVTPEQQTELRRAFIALDRDHSGMLCRSEFHEVGGNLL